MVPTIYLTLDSPPDQDGDYTLTLHYRETNGTVLTNVIGPLRITRGE